MKYSKDCKRLIGALNLEAANILKTLEKYEQGEFFACSELCSAISKDFQLVTFSCIFDNIIDQKLGTDLGKMFNGRIKKTVINLINEIKAYNYTNGLVVILDDCEPTRVWGWPIKEEITIWYQMVIEENKNQIPDGWKVFLWSEIEKKIPISYEDILKQLDSQNYALLIHQQLEHMKKFPNKKIVGNAREAVLRRTAEYSLQGQIIEKIFPNAVLIQTETPWDVKDPRYSPLRKTALPIIHPYPEERK